MYSINNDKDVIVEAILYSYHPVVNTGEDNLLIFLGHYEGSLDTQIFVAMADKKTTRTEIIKSWSYSFSTLHEEGSITFSSDDLTISIEVDDGDLKLEIVDATLTFSGGCLIRTNETIIVPKSIRYPVPF